MPRIKEKPRIAQGFSRGMASDQKWKEAPKLKVLRLSPTSITL